MNFRKLTQKKTYKKMNLICWDCGYKILQDYYLRAAKAGLCATCLDAIEINIDNIESAIWASSL